MGFLSKTLKNHKAEFSKFCLVGGLSTIINYGLFYLLYRTLMIYYLFSSAIGYLSGTLFGFYLNKVFTFRSNSKKYTVDITKYFIIYLISLFLGLIFLKGLVFLGVNIFLANLFVIGLTTITNYIGSKYFVFSKSSIIGRLDYFVFKYRYFLRYFLIGVISVIIELGVILSLRGIIPIGYLMAGGFLLSLLFAFFINLKFNFQIDRRENLRAFSYFTIIATSVYLLNLLAINLFTKLTILNYSFSRMITAGTFFLLSYFLHKNITFKNTKKVGVAIYLQSRTDVEEIRKKIGDFVDWIHIDLIDSTMSKDAPEVNVSKGLEVRALWPGHKIMTHIMSTKPSKWIDQVAVFSDVIIFHSKIEENSEHIIQKIHSLGKKAGICILAKNGPDISTEVLNKVDFVQVLGIDTPGVYGQAMNKDTLLVLSRINNLRKDHDFRVCIDGGVNHSNASSINAEYIVSGSAILNSKNARMSIYGLKTSMKVSEGKKLKTFLKQKIFEAVGNKSFVKSVTLVGSFVDSSGLEGISDLDIVVIVDKLEKKKFTELGNSLNGISEELFNKWGYRMKINSTFGPLKFNDPDTVVLHLMVYDVEGHKTHCIKSPFTCLDWQRSPIHFKKSLREIMDIGKLQPTYFFSSRRSINDYMKDIQNGTISYREYEFGKTIKENLKHKKMENRDKFEFSYHIIKFCMTNFLKLYFHKNFNFKFDRLLKEYFTIFSKNKKTYLKYLKNLRKQKIQGAFAKWSNKDEEILRNFLSDFHLQFERYFYQNSRKIYFIRHQETEMNQKNVFLGQRNDPPIKNIFSLSEKRVSSLIDETALAYCSQSKRAMQTAEHFFSKEKIKKNVLLNEIDYGLLDGKTLTDLKEDYSYLLEGWKEGKDPRFPGGENTRDVLNRLKIFLSSLIKSKKDCNYFIFTHNVFIRCLIGEFLNIPKSKWFKIPVSHLEPLEVILTKNRHLYINLSQEQSDKIFKGVYSK